MKDEHYLLIINSLIKIIESDLLPICKLIYNTGCNTHSVEETDKTFKLYDDVLKGIKDILKEKVL